MLKDLLRHACRGTDAAAGSLDNVVALFSEGRHFGHLGPAFVGHLAERADQAFFGVGNRFAHVEDAKRDVTAEQGCTHCGCAGEGYVGHLDPGLSLQRQCREVIVRADPGCTEGYRVWILFRIGDQSVQSLEFVLLPDVKAAGVVDNVRDRGEVLQLIASIALDRDGHQVWRIEKADGVAVRLSLGNLRESDFAPCTGLVYDSDRAPEIGLDEGGERAGGDIGSTARTVGDDHCDRSFRELRLCVTGRRKCSDADSASHRGVSQKSCHLSSQKALPLARPCLYFFCA